MKRWLMDILACPVSDCRSKLNLEVYKSHTQESEEEDVNEIDAFEIHGVHSNLADVKRHLYKNNMSQFYDDAFKFSIVRNPYTHLVSLYRYIRRAKKHQYHKRVMSMNFWQYLNWYTLDMIPTEMPYGTNKYQFMHQFMTQLDTQIHNVYNILEFFQARYVLLLVLLWLFQHFQQFANHTLQHCKNRYGRAILSAHHSLQADTQYPPWLFVDRSYGKVYCNFYRSKN